MKTRFTVQFLNFVVAIFLVAVILVPVGSIHAQPELGVRTLALTGEINFSGCTSEEEDKVRLAMEHVVSNLFVDSAFPRCLRNTILSQTNGDSPEAMLERLREPMPTRIECKDVVCGNPEASGCAPVEISTESISLQKANVMNATVESIAGTIIHELAHNKGWNHPPSGAFADFNFRVPNQMGRCMSSGFSRNLQRNLASGETTLAGAGGGGGEPFERTCPGAGFAVGGVTQVSGSLTQFALLCQIGMSGAIGSTDDSSVRTSKSCRPEELVVGAWGTADRLVNQLGLLCAPRDQIEAKNIAWIRSIGLGGAPEGLPFERLCPAGMAVKAIQGQAGQRIDQLQLVCESLDSRRRETRQQLAFSGTRTGNAGGGTCLGNGLLIGLFGGAGGEVDKLGGVCRTTTSGPFGVPTIGPDDSAHIVDGVGGDGGTRFGDNCPAGHALVGVQIRSAERVNQIAGICAEPSEWSSLTPTPSRNMTPTRGASTSGTSRTLECERGSYMVGFEVWSRQTVHATPTVQGMAPICRDLTLEPEIAPN